MWYDHGDAEHNPDPCGEHGHKWRRYQDPAEDGPCVRCGEQPETARERPPLSATILLEEIEARAQEARAAALALQEEARAWPPGKWGPEHDSVVRRSNMLSSAAYVVREVLAEEDEP